MGTKLTPVAFDIETSGFETDAVVTAIGFVLPLGCRVMLNTDQQSVGQATLETTLANRFNTTIKLSCHQTEQELLESLTEFATDSLTPKEYLLVAYNGERFRSGFDLPFLRTRYTRQDVAWPFIDVPYADLMPIFQHRFNTQRDDESAADLEGVYETIVDNELTALDPFEDSNQAVEAFETGDFEALLQHNIADVLRTDALATVAERYCGKSEFKLKSLTPTVFDSTLS
jgi:uncharacterized protein YprB with RNaseH-like and TPR domain